WKLNMVTFKEASTPHLLKSKADVDAAVTAGEVTVTATNTVINCPVLGFGQKKVPGVSNGHVMHYYDLGARKGAPGSAVRPAPPHPRRAPPPPVRPGLRRVTNKDASWAVRSASRASEPAPEPHPPRRLDRPRG